jgi:putative flippase GtrA
MAILRQRFIELIPELTKFGVVGMVGAIIDLGGAAYLHGAMGIGPMISKALSIAAATVVTYLGSRFWTFRHRVNQALLREGTLFAVLNLIGLVIAEIVIAFTTYGLGLKSALAYNAASVIGTGLGTIFRYFSYKKWVFLAGAPGVAVAAGEATISGLVDASETSESGAVLVGAPDGYGPPWELGHGWPPEYGYGRPAEHGYGRPAEHGYGRPAEHGYGRPAEHRYGRPAEHRYGRPAERGRGRPPWELGYEQPGDGGYGPPSEQLDPADSDARQRY